MNARLGRPGDIGKARHLAEILALASVLGFLSLPLRAEELENETRARNLDPLNFPYVEQVCMPCHTPSKYLRSRTLKEWIAVFDEMYQFGATGTDDQWDHVSDYFVNNLTILNVNRSDVEEIAAVLKVSDDTATAIVRRRGERIFSGIADLESVAGVDSARVEAMKARLLF